MGYDDSRPNYIKRFESLRSKNWYKSMYFVVLGMIALLDCIKVMFFGKDLDTIFSLIMALSCLFWMFDIIITCILLKWEYFCKFFFFADMASLLSQFGIITATSTTNFLLFNFIKLIMISRLTNVVILIK